MSDMELSQTFRYVSWLDRASGDLSVHRVAPQKQLGELRLILP